MSRHDQASVIAALLHPLPEPGTVEPAEAFDDAVDEIQRRQDEYAEQLRTAADETASDLVLEALAAEAATKEAADARMRLLLGYARHFVAPRGYQLDTLAKACHLTDRGVNKIANAQVDNVARVLGTPPVRGQEPQKQDRASQDDVGLRELARAAAEALRTLDLNNKDACSSLAQTLEDAGIEPSMHVHHLESPTPPKLLSIGASAQESVDAAIGASGRISSALLILSTWPAHMRIEHKLGILLSALLSPTLPSSPSRYLAGIRDELLELSGQGDEPAARS